MKKYLFPFLWFYNLWDIIPSALTLLGVLRLKFFPFQTGVQGITPAGVAKPRKAKPAETVQRQSAGGAKKGRADRHPFAVSELKSTS